MFLFLLGISSTFLDSPAHLSYCYIVGGTYHTEAMLTISCTVSQISSSNLKLVFRIFICGNFFIDGRQYILQLLLLLKWRNFYPLSMSGTSLQLLHMTFYILGSISLLYATWAVRHLTSFVSVINVAYLQIHASSLVDIERDFLSLDKRYPRLFVSPEFSKVCLTDSPQLKDIKVCLIIVVI